jgi:2-oxopent-4-enoate/cis-2-oxohex-4-enoate hydratase
MPLLPAEIEQVVTTLAHARTTATSCDPPTARFPELSIDDAYAISRAHFDRRLRKGERDAGRKIGLTSAAHRDRYRATEPSFGYLTDLVRFRDRVPAREVLSPAAEGEVVFFLNRDLDASGMTPDDVIAAVDHICLGIEITDRRIGKPPFKIQDHVADNAFACGYVIGTENRSVTAVDLPDLRIRGTKNGVEEASGVGSELMGSPLHALVWLANRLVERDEPLRAGQLVFSGSFGPPIAFQQGDVLRFSCDELGSLAIACEA